jgi:hypothetical protein
MGDNAKETKCPSGRFDMMWIIYQLKVAMAVHVLNAADIVG